MRVEVMRQFPFPSEKHHVLPGVVWRAVAKKYKTRYFNESLRIYYVNEGDRADQMSFHQDISVVGFGKRETALDLLNNYLPWLVRAPLELCRSLYVYTQVSLELGYGFSDQIRAINPMPAKILFLFARPFVGVWKILPRQVESKVRGLLGYS